MKQLKIKNEKENIHLFLDHISKNFNIKLQKGLPTSKVILHKNLISEEGGYFYDPYREDYIECFEFTEGPPILIKNSDNNFNKRPTLLKFSQRYIEILTNLKINTNYPIYNSVSIESEKHYKMIRYFKKFSKNLIWFNNYKNIWIVPAYVYLETKDITNILFDNNDDTLNIKLGNDAFCLAPNNLVFDYLDNETLIVRERKGNCVIIKGDKKALLEIVDNINLELMI